LYVISVCYYCLLYLAWFKSGGAGLGSRPLLLVNSQYTCTWTDRFSGSLQTCTNFLESARASCLIKQLGNFINLETRWRGFKSCPQLIICFLKVQTLIFCSNSMGPRGCSNFKLFSPVLWLLFRYMSAGCFYALNVALFIWSLITIQAWVSGLT
jgi:hypothetical protein